MTVSPFGSIIYQELFSDQEISFIFSDQEHIRSMIAVEMALAHVQGELNIIPKKIAQQITNHLKNVKIEAKDLSQGTTKDGVVVPTLVKLLQKEMGDDKASYLHYGVTSQDILDTALVLQSAKVIEIYEKRIDSLIKNLSALAHNHRATIMAARTRSQISTPTSFGLKAANWLMPFKRHKQRLQQLKQRFLILSFGGASGTLSALSPKDAKATAQGLAEKLGLTLPPAPWHSQRDNIGEIGSFCTLLTGSMAKMASDIIFLCASGINELSIIGGGTSSTMPQKNNPALAETIVALARSNINLCTSLQIHNQERDGAAWQLEWITLPNILNNTGACLKHTINLIDALIINDDVMTSNIKNTDGTLLAEAASFLLSQYMSRPEAQKIVAKACQTAVTTKIHLFDILENETKHDIDWQDQKELKKHIGLNDQFINDIIQ